MKTQIINFLFLAILCSFSSNISALEIQEHPLYNIMLSQISIMSEEATEGIGFDTIIGLLNELKDTNLRELHKSENFLKSFTLNCEVSNVTLNTNLNNLRTILLNYTKTEDNLSNKEKTNKTVFETQKKLKILNATKEDYIKSYKETNESYINFMKIAKEAVKLIGECGLPSLNILYDSKKDNSTGSNKVIETATDEYTACYNKYDHLLTDKLSHFDDTENLTFNNQIALYLNNTDFDCMDGNYLKGISSTLELIKTIKQFIQYKYSKIKFFANYTQQIFLYDTEISQLKKLLEDYIVNNNNYDKMGRELTKLINGTNEAIKNVLKSISLLTSDCNTQISILHTKIQSYKSEEISLKMLIDYFKNNYAKITESFRKKYSSEHKNAYLIETKERLINDKNKLRKIMHKMKK